LKAQNAALAAQVAALTTQVAHLTAQSSREIALLQAAAVKSFGAERFLAEAIKVAFKTSACQLGEMIRKFYPEVTWNQELDAIQKWASASPVDDAIAMVQRRFPSLRVVRFPPSAKKGGQFDAPGGIIAHLTRGGSGNVHDRHVGDVTSGSFEKQMQQPYGGILAKNAADLGTD
jgi:hypothetical protein